MYYWYEELNLRPFSLEEHLKEVKIAREKNKRGREERENVARENFNRFQIGDTLLIRYPIDELENGYRRASPYFDPHSWEFNDDKDFLIKGKLIDKIDYESGAEGFRFNLKVISVNRADTYFFMKYVKPNDTLNIDVILHPSSIFLLK
jgi:hypothetical protein